MISRPRRLRARWRRSTSFCRRDKQLSNLITYMDGPHRAEDLIANALHDPALLQAAWLRRPNPKAAIPKPERTVRSSHG